MARRFSFGNILDGAIRVLDGAQCAGYARALSDRRFRSEEIFSARFLGCSSGRSRSCGDRRWRRDGLRALSVVPLLGLIALVPLGYASPPDADWPASLFDAADFDDVIALATSHVVHARLSGLSGPSPDWWIILVVIEILARTRRVRLPLVSIVTDRSRGPPAGSRDVTSSPRRTGPHRPCSSGSVFRIMPLGILISLQYFSVTICAQAWSRQTDVVPTNDEPRRTAPAMPSTAFAAQASRPPCDGHGETVTVAGTLPNSSSRSARSPPVSSRSSEMG